jgi:hypothetical protein
MFRALLAAMLLFSSASVPAAPFTPDAAQDPVRERFEEALISKLRDHPTLVRVRLERVWDHAPFLFLVQVPEGAKTDYAEKVISRRLEWLNALHQRFNEDYAEPMRLRLRREGPYFVVVLLATAESFTTCTSGVRKGEPPEHSAWYNPEDRFLYLDEEASRGSSADDLAEHNFAMGEAARMVVHGYGHLLSNSPGPLWFSEGIAGDLGAHSSMSAEAIGARTVPGPFLSRLIDVVQQSDARKVYLLPLSIFQSISSGNDVMRMCARRVAKGATSSLDKKEALTTFEAMACVLFHYLTHAAPEKVRGRVKVYNEMALKNRLGRKTLGEVLTGIDLDQLERDFYLYAWKEARQARPARALDAAQFGAFLTERDWSGDDVEALSESGVAERLAGLIDVDAHLALAIARARMGDFEAGVALLESSSARALSEEIAERLDRELGRLRAWCEVRNRFFHHLVGFDKAFSFAHQGKRMTAKVEAFEDGRVRFAANRRDIDSLSLTEIDQVELGRQMRNRKWGFEANWATAVPCALALDPKVKRYLKDDSPEAKALVQDVESDYPGRVEAIEVAAQLIELSDIGSPESSEGARRALTLIEAIWKRKDEVSYLAALEGDLRTLAETCLARLFDEDGLEAVLKAKVKRLADGRVQLTYDFTKQEQLRDWKLEETPGSRHSKFPDLQREDSSFECVGEKLLGVGRTSLTHQLRFEGPQKIRWKSKMLGGEKEEAQLEVTYEVAFCCGPRSSRIAVVNSINLDVVDAKTGEFIRQSPDEVEVRFDKEYQHELQLDSREKVSFSRDSGEIFKGSSRKCRSGEVRLWLHSDYAVEFDDFEITGQVMDGSLATLRDKWVAEEIASLGL